MSKNVFYQMAETIKNNKDSVKENIKNDLRKEYKMQVEKMMKVAADAFYEDYSPHMYVRHKRQRTLENMYKIHTDKYLYVELGGEFSKNKHRVSNEYIYDHMFKGGWHGGAIDGPWHPSPGDLWYRKWNQEIGAYYAWSRPAKRMAGDTPYDIFMNLYEKYISTELLEFVAKSFEERIWELFK